MCQISFHRQRKFQGIVWLLQSSRSDACIRHKNALQGSNGVLYWCVYDFSSTAALYSHLFVAKERVLDSAIWHVVSIQRQLNWMSSVKFQNESLKSKIYGIIISHSFMELSKSSFFGRQTFVGFYVDWTIEVFTCLCYFTILTTSMSLIIGFCLYINGLVTDLRIQTSRIGSVKDEHSSLDGAAWIGFVKEIQFHNQIIE